MSKKEDVEKDLFSCRQCGHCCHGETTVSLDPDDFDRMSEYLKLPKEQVLEKYLRKTENVIQMKILDGHCIFYREGCTIHTGKPWRCCQWPLHPSILTDAANLEAIKDSCPGITRKLDYQEFCRKFKEYLGTDEN